MKAKQNSRTIIDRYEQPIYPIRNLYVIKNYKKGDIDKKFYQSDIDSIESKCNPYVATCVLCKRRSDNRTVVLIVLSEGLCKNAKKELIYSIGVCAHEALHAACFMLRESADTELTSDTEESYSYLTEWVTNCAVTTLLK